MAKKVKKTKDNLKAQERKRYQELMTQAKSLRKVNMSLRRKYREDDTFMEGVRETLIKDLLRVFNTPENPYAGWAASRKRYRELGHYPEVIVADCFGNHQEFQRAAGLHDTRGTAKVKNLTARISTEKKIEKYANDSIVPYYGLYDTHFQAMNNVVRGLVVGDIHGRYRDPFAWVVFLDLVRMVKPNFIVLNGDVVDFPKVSRYTKMPGACNIGLQEEIDFVRKEIFGSIRKIYDGPLVWHLGNHEQRLARYLADTAPDLADLRCLRYDELFGVKDYQVQLVFGGKWLAPYQSGRSKNIRRTHKVYYDCFCVSHGTAMGPKAGEAEIKYFGMAGCSGHTHRPGIFMQGTEANPGLTWTNPGMLAHKACAVDYRESRVNEWGMGIGLFTIEPAKRLVIPELCIVHEELATFAGKIYRPSARVQKMRAELWI
jgi:predicted phosphodiesterase